MSTVYDVDLPYDTPLPYDGGEVAPATPDFPTLLIETSLTTDPLAEPDWADQSEYATGVTFRRGRDQALEGQFQPGTATVTFDNPDRRFDPTHAGGPHYGDLVPGKRLRVRAEWDGTTYDLFGGFVDGWPQEYQFPFAASTRVPVTDGFTMLNRTELGDSPFESVLESLAPVHWWKLGEDTGSEVATDSGPGRSDGIVRGAAQDGLGADGLDPTSDAKALNISPSFEGYVDVSGALATWTSMSFIVRVDTSHATRGRVIYDGPSRMVKILPNTAAQPGAIAVLDRGGSGERSSGSLVGGTHDVVLVRTGTNNFLVYVDGVDVTASGGASSLTLAPVVSSVGDTTAGADEGPFDGVLQHVALYDRQLTADEAALLHQSSLGEFDGDTSGARLARLLDLAGWPTADRDIDTGTVTLEGVTENQWASTVLDTTRLIEASEAGAFYQEPDYTMRFRDRYDHLTSSRSTTSQYTFSDEDTTGVYRYEDLSFPEQSTYLYNRVKVAWLGGEVVVSDAASIAAYGPREHSETTILPTAAQARARAEWTLDHYSEPVLRIDSIILNPGADPRLWLPCLDLRIGDRVTVRKHPQEVGDPIEAEVIVEGIAGSVGRGINEGLWTLSVSAADTQNYWILGTSQLEVDTRLA